MRQEGRLAIGAASGPSVYAERETLSTILMDGSERRLPFASTAKCSLSTKTGVAQGQLDTGNNGL